MYTSTLYVGIDVSKSKHDVAILDEGKKLLRRPFVITEDKQEYEKLLEIIGNEQHKTQASRVVIGMEATADYWRNLYHFLWESAAEPGRFQLVVINPFQSRAFARAELRRAKTDPVDAKEIARYLVEKQPRGYQHRQRLLDYIVDLDRQLYGVKKQKSRTINRLRHELFKVAPEIEREKRYLDRGQILALLEVFSTAEQIDQATFSQLKAITYGKHAWHLPDNFIHRMKSLSRHSIGYKRGVGADRVIQSLVRQVQNDNREIETLKAQLLELYATIRQEDSILTSIGHFSKSNAVALEACLGDVRRFPNKKAIVAFYGMNPIIEESGSSRKRRSRLQKKGNGYVRYKLYMAVLSMIRRKKEPIYSYYTRLVANGKPKMVAIGACMRKLLIIIYQILKNNIPFDENYAKKN
ncbi:MAG TPA: IS110 family transposase [Caldithrix sp.]|nr:IS110 family transposase [Caldithrix sp.]